MTVPSVSHSITVRLEVAAREQLNPHYIVPSVFHPDAASRVAAAVRTAVATESDG